MNLNNSTEPFTMINVKEGIQRWACFTKNNTPTDILNRLFFEAPNKDTESQCIQILKPKFEKWKTDSKALLVKGLKARSNTTYTPKAGYQTPPSIYVYIGLNPSYNKIEFYFIDSYLANLESDININNDSILKCNFKTITNAVGQDHPLEIPNEISYTEAKKRCSAWRDSIEKRTWAETILAEHNMVRMFTIPMRDFNMVFDNQPNSNSLYLYFGLTPDLRTNAYPTKIELIASNYPPPPLALTNPTAPNLPTKSNYYNITIPNPPF